MPRTAAGADGEGKVSTLGHNYRSDAENSVVDDGQPSEEMLFKIFRRLQLNVTFCSTMMSVNTILSFFIQPLQRCFMDHYGRWPIACTSPIATGGNSPYDGFKAIQNNIHFIEYASGLGDTGSRMQGDVQ